ncbi:elongation factor G [Nitrospiraceae bacterium AH_259_D15_M11_P09]|nr:elongation factor G [Nitrospiraceae bacterium AH_259_D15_M11_P09]
MKEPRADMIRNIAVVSYTGAGKTSLLEALLYTAGAIPAMGSVLSGNTVSDFEPEEIHRRISISLGVAHFDWKDTTFNLVDAPGALSFLGEAELALRAVDGVLIVVGASSGVKTELEKTWSTIQELGLPCVLFINELDKERTTVGPVLEQCEHALELKGLPVTIPIGAESQLEGVLDLVEGVGYKSTKESNKVQRVSPPAELEGLLAEAKKKLVEGVAETEDRLVEKYLAEGDLTVEEIRSGLKVGTQSKALVPVLCGSAVRNIGTAVLLDALAAYLPSPAEAATRRPLVGTHPGTGESATRVPTPSEPLSAYVFKTIIDPFMGRLTYARVLSGTLEADSAFYNPTRSVKEKGGHLFSILGKKYTQVPKVSAGDICAIGKLKDTQTGDTITDEHHLVVYPPLQLPKPVLSFAIEPKSKVDVEKVSLGLHKLVEEDATLEFVRNRETKEMVLSGTGQLHVDVTFEKLRRKYGVEVNVHTPKVPYKETIRKMAQAQGKHKKQTGGHGQYGDCWLQIDPLPRAQGFRFENKIVGGAIPRNFIPAVEKGVVEAMQGGILGGFPVVDLRVAVYDGSYHTVDSSEMAFKIAGSMGFKKALESAHPVLLEPIMTVEITAADDCVGAVIGDLNSRRGRINGVVSKGTTQVINAAVPLAEMLKYASTLNSITGGRGTYGMEFSTYEEVPRELATRIIDEQKAAKQAVAS